MFDDSDKNGNLVRVQQPKFLSVVGKPANRIAFKVVRSDSEKGNSMKPVVIRRTRRSDPSPILRMTFPAAYSDEQVTEQMKTFGLTGYNVARSEAGVIATRSDLQSIATELTSIRLTEDGIVAEVARTEQPTNPKSAVAVVSLSFRSDKFTVEAAKKWLADAGIEVSAEPVAGEGDIEVVRHAVSEDTERRVVQLEDGVSATIIRSDDEDIPEGYVAAVNETAYGNWGWGQLDFNARMADVAFTEVMDEAVWQLRRVLEDILLYSALPLADRKTLMVNATEQFKAFTVGILDSLPRTVLVAVARSASQPKESTGMTTKHEGGASTPTPAPAAGTQDSPTPVTRADFEQLVATVGGLSAAINKITEAQQVSRSDAPAETPAAAPSETTPEPAAVTITRADVEEAVKAAVSAVAEPLVKRLDALEGTTVLRSDSGDGKITATNQPNATGTKKDVFRGATVFGGLGLKSVRPAA